MVPHPDKTSFPLPGLFLPLLLPLLLVAIVTSRASAGGGDPPILELLAPPCPEADVPHARVDLPADRMRLPRPATFRAAAPPPTGALHHDLLSPPPITLRHDFLFTGVDPEGDSPTDIAFTPDGSRILIAHRDTRNLIVFNAATRVVIGAIALSGSPNSVAVSSDGQYAVTANVYEDTASIVDLAGGLEIATVAIGEQPGVVRITPDGTIAVVGNTVSSELSVIDIATATELRRIPNAGFVASVSVNFEPGAIAMTFSQFELADDSTIVHPDFYAGRVRLFDIATGNETTVVTDSYPRELDVTPDGATAVVAHTSTIEKISVIDVATGTVTKTVAIGTTCYGPICIRPDGGKALVGVQNACRMVDLVTGTVGASLNTASVYQLHTTADGNHAFCVGYYGSLIDFQTDALLGHLNGFVSCSYGAVSPTAPRAAIVANTFGEEMVVVNTDGATGHLEGIVPSGAPPEADRTRSAAITPDGTRAVTLGILGDTATILDLTTGSVEAIVEVGDRPSEVEITPDGSLAVVANLDSTFASVIDLDTFAVTNISISRRASQVEISPDGHHAYLCVVADGDGVWRIDLDTLSVTGSKITTGNMGSIGFLHNQTSGMTLSHDGAVLAVCGSFDDNVSLVDTVGWSLIKNVAIGDFPVRAVFTHDDSSILVTCSNDDSLVEISNAGAASAVTATIPVGGKPFEMAISPDDSTLYLLNYSDKALGIVDLATNTMTATIGLSESPAGLHLDPDGAFLYIPVGRWSVSLGPGPVFSITHVGMIDVIGLRTTRDFTVDTGLPPAMLAFDADGAVGLVPSPLGDGVVRLRILGR
jgi:YVTN family beta-propeller protein